MLTNPGKQNGKHSPKTDKFFNMYWVKSCMNSPKGVKSAVPKRLSISCPTCDIRFNKLLKNK